MPEPLKAIHINRTDAEGRYLELFEVCDELRSKYGGAANVLKELASQADEYKAAMRAVRRTRKSQADAPSS